MHTHCLRTAVFLLFASTSVAAQSCPTVIDVYPGTSGAWPISVTCAFGNTLYFSPRHPTYGSEPWTWNSTNGAKLLKDIRPGATGSNPRIFNRSQSG